jgi:type 1 glutamine amidotransferase
MNLPKHFTLSILAVLFLSGIGGAAPTKVLVIEGASNHDWQRRIENFRSILSRDGSFEMDVSLVPQDDASPEWAAWNPNFSSYDVVLSGYSNAAGGAS